ncbi:MAG: acetolactate synthase catalytic subunit [Alphaproteobacteria bacterium]|nr:acetolactate synthase catalytic subunit [Alphaproteobacteria bacterium]
MRGTGGRLLYETLKSYGVTCLFGMEDPIHVFHAVDRAATRIVTIRDEKHGAIMAHAYAQVTGRPGVCAATTGPGASNLVTGLLEALRSSVPVVALVQDHPLRLKGRNASSELDHEAALAPYVKAVIRIHQAERVPDMVRRAFRLATGGRPGPIALLCPTDVMAAEADADTAAEPIYAQYPALRSRAAADGLLEAARALAKARAPLLVAGGGCISSGACVEIAALAERFAVPVATTLLGKGAIADMHPLSVGVLGSSTGGLYGRGKIPNALMAEADVVFIMGSRTGQLVFSDWALVQPGATVIHLDIAPEEIGRNFATRIPLLGDVRDSLRDLLALSDRHGLARRDPGNGGRLEVMKEEWRRELAPVATSDRQPMRPERVMAEVERIVDASTLLVTDASYSSGWAMSQLSVPVAGRFMLSPRGTASIGWGLPAAIGAKLADPGRQVVCVTGDGGFGYVMNELETAARHAVDMLVIVFNNGTLAFQRHWEEHALGSYRECDFLDVDYSEVARALRCRGERVRDPADLAAAIGRGLACNGPYLIDAVIDPEAAAPIVGFNKPLPADASH